MMCIYDLCLFTFQLHNDDTVSELNETQSSAISRRLRGNLKRESDGKRNDSSPVPSMLNEQQESNTQMAVNERQKHSTSLFDQIARTNALDDTPKLWMQLVGCDTYRWPCFDLAVAKLFCKLQIAL